MNFKEKVLIKIRNVAQFNLNKELNNYKKIQNKAIKSGKYDWIRTSTNNVNSIKERIMFLIETLEKLDELKWTSDVELIKECLSEYGTFCDRYTMYYDKMLEIKPIDEVTNIIVCEYFNSLQDYFSGTLTEKCRRETRSTSFICLYRMGLVEETKMSWYSQSIRRDIWDKFFKKYPQCKGKYITFEPNLKAAKHLFDKMVFNDPEERLGRVKKVETAEILRVELHEKTFNLTSFEGIRTFYRDDFKPGTWNYRNVQYRYAYFEKGLDDGQYTRLNALKKMVKDNKEYIAMTEKLSNC